jgi:hypothetical protein
MIVVNPYVVYYGRIIDCCIILHNLLVDVGEDTIPEEWMEDNDLMDDVMDDDVMDDDVAGDVGEYDYTAPIQNYHQKDENRQRCFRYFKNRFSR